MMSLRDKLIGKTAHVGVIGLGYVGLPLAVEMCRAGYRVTGIDVDPSKVERIGRGETEIGDVDAARLAEGVASGQLRATTDYGAIRGVDAVSVCVPTPLRKTKDPDISYVRDAVDRVSDNLEGEVLVVLESTTYPGTTEELVAPGLVARGRTLGVDTFVAFSPERVDPGNPVYKTRNTPKVVGGVTPLCGEMAALYYTGVVEQVHQVGSAREAEMVKLLENTFRAVNIALVNEMLLMCDRMGIDIWRVVEAAATKPFGFTPFWPGPGIGGHCIPVDPTYLSWKAKTYDFFNRFIELATDINGNMPRFVVQKLMRALNDQSKALRGSRILVMGVAYKPGVTDTREAPGIEIMRLIEEMGANVAYHDGMVPRLELAEGRRLDSVPITADALAGYDAVVIATAHPGDPLEVVAGAPLVLDTRNALQGFEGGNVVKL
jgi:UDP-N-acetyl-D-glucosamine dehydrogenase